MTTIVIKDANGALVYMNGSGAGTQGDPFVSSNSVNNFPAIQITSGSITNAVGNPIPVNLVSGSISLTAGSTVNIANLPAIQVTSGCITNFPGTFSGSITNFPLIQVTSGCVTNFPTTFSGSLTNATIASTDSGPSWVSSHGVGGSPVVLASGSVATNVTDAPTSGQKLVITDIFVSTQTAMQVTFKCETTNAPIAGPFDLSASVPLQFSPRSKAWKLATADKHLQILTSVSGSIMIDPHYYSEA